ncbi:hypothetical protein LCGC14_2350710 [marine sediment metagenome]|uniref:Phage head-tail adaptor n=1 Tax=marine sediment metagenome TaxID=412755 RepID=A0A0F9C970_9ZZZZ|nr:head-tail adaptor protein [Candidatus Scalindua sp.]
MVICKRIKSTNTQICSGALNTCIEIVTRTQIAPSGNDVDSTIAFSTLFTVRASVIKTKTGFASGFQPFGATNISEVSTHVFTVRFLNGLDTTMFVRLNSEYYKILFIHNSEESDSLLELVCSKRGDQALEVNER